MIPLKFNHSHSSAHFGLILNYLKGRIIKTISLKGYKVKKGNRFIVQNCSSGLILYLKLLYNDRLQYKLDDLICLSPDKLESFVTDLKNKHPNFFDPEHFDNVALQRIFVKTYDNVKVFDKMVFINRFSLNTCPYCNRNYIYTIRRDREIKPEIDHFYPRSINPILAVTFSNLIPSCSSCNGINGKKNSDPIKDRIISPYLIKSNDFKFSFLIKSISILHPLCGKSSIDVVLKNKIDGNCKLFNLEALYSKHDDHVLELLIKRKIKYSEKQRKYLKSYKGLKFDNHEIDRMILGNYSLEKDQHKRPLAKLYQDIGKELRLI